MYGAWFLRDAGYFDPAKRFWTSKPFPDSGAVRDQIKTRLKTIGLSDPSLQQAHEALAGE